MTKINNYFTIQLKNNAGESPPSPASVSSTTIPDDTEDNHMSSYTTIKINNPAQFFGNEARYKIENDTIYCVFWLYQLHCAINARKTSDRYCKLVFRQFIFKETMEYKSYYTTDTISKQIEVFMAAILENMQNGHLEHLPRCREYTSSGSYFSTYNEDKYFDSYIALNEYRLRRFPDSPNSVLLHNLKKEGDHLNICRHKTALC